MAAAPHLHTHTHRSTTGNTLTVNASDILVKLPPSMNGGGCGIEFIEHEIYGGLYSQMLLDESFEQVANASTGVTCVAMPVQCPVDGCNVRGNAGAVSC